MKNLDLSFVIPAKNEENSVDQLYAEIVSTTKKIKKNYEIIFIDDGSTDNTFEKLKKLQSKDKNIKIIRRKVEDGEMEKEKLFYKYLPFSPISPFLLNLFIFLRL